MARFPLTAAALKQEAEALISGLLAQPAFKSAIQELLMASVKELRDALDGAKTSVDSLTAKVRAGIRLRDRPGRSGPGARRGEHPAADRGRALGLAAGAEGIRAREHCRLFGLSCAFPPDVDKATTPPTFADGKNHVCTLLQL